MITLIAETPVIRDVERASSAFATPTIVHFASVLLLSAVISVPWHAIAGPAIVWGLLGLAGVIYVVIVARRVRVQTAYSPQFEDRPFYVLLPFLAYAVLILAAYMARSHARDALFVVRAAALLLLFVAIHNAWDSVTYHVFVTKLAKDKGEQRE